jgi:tRNA-Thr(GGU) m(6)t(6)A37 methyltransferase TsaA
MNEPTWGRVPLTLQPIGVVRSPYRERFGTPRQATVAAGSATGQAEEATLELFGDRVPPDILRDLDGFSHLWAIVWFDRNEGWRPTVTPTRGPRKKRGLFSTRSPHRPCPIGLSALRIVAVEGLTVRVLGVDLLDGTPLLDIKPYVPYADAFPDAAIGWLAEVAGPDDGPDRATRTPGRHRRTPAETVSSDPGATDPAKTTP